MPTSTESPTKVQLYVYDLSQGLARSMSAALLGRQIDAVYHTSIVMEGIEYVYDGGIKQIVPGSSHLGRPIDVIELGDTELPISIIIEYLESLKEIYTYEAYDIWSHNCNNFSNDFATFLLGTGIPDYITNLPQTVLNTPFGRAIAPNISKMVDQRQQRSGGLVGVTPAIQPAQKQQTLVRNAESVAQLEGLLNEAKRSCAVIFFTSATCAPCKTLYPLYDELAEEAAHKAVLIKVDISKSWDISTRYQVKATPTFVTLLRGEQENRWSGSEPATLRGNVKMLVQMAWPLHPHESLSLPTFHGSNTKPVLYSKSPPLEKLKAKMGPSVQDPAILGVLNFVSTRNQAGAAEVTLPDLNAFSKFLQSAPSQLPPEIMFTIVDLFRVALVDPRFSGFYAEQKDHKTIAHLISYVNSLKDCPYSLRLATLQMCCNLFSTHLYPPHILNDPILSTPTILLITTSLLDSKHHHVRVAAASLSLNIALSNNKIRREQHIESLPEDDQVELAASLLETIGVEQDSSDALKGFLLAFAWLVYCTPEESELRDLLKAMDAQGTVKGKGKKFPGEGLVRDVGDVLLGHI